MKIYPNELNHIRQGLASQLLKLKMSHERKSITEIQILLDRFDDMEKDFYASQRVSSDTESE
tara:strand:- start:3046 stop:3231 length:186 start_codon:yes stop_codon:yes gene_type:complete